MRYLLRRGRIEEGDEVLDGEDCVMGGYWVKNRDQCMRGVKYNCQQDCFFQAYPGGMCLDPSL